MTIAPHIAKLSDSERLMSLEHAELLDTLPEPCFDRITSLLAQLLGTKTALLSLVDIDRQFFKSQHGLPLPYSETRQTPLSHSFCQYVVSSQEPLVVENARELPLLDGNGAIDDLGVISYLGAPVHGENGKVIGSLCAIGDAPRKWSQADIALIDKLAAIVDDEIALRQKARKAEQLAEENAFLAREYHHRVKNALAVSAALVKLASKHATSVSDLTDEVSSRLIALANAHDALISIGDHVDLQELALKLLQPYGPVNWTADVSGPPVELKHNQITPICLFLHELATNSAKYGALRQHGQVLVRWDITTSNQNVHLTWREQLEEEPAIGENGFGTILLKTAARQLRGRYDVQTSANRLSIELEFPLDSA